MLVKPSLITSLSTNQRNLDDASLRISTGKRLNRASDDPSGFSRVMITNASISRSSVSLNVLERGMDRLDGRDQVLGSLIDVTQRFQELATMASSGLYKTQDILPEMQQLEKAALSMGNTRDASGFMFSGTADTQPFTTDAAGNASYNGTTTPFTINVEGVSISGSVNGTPLLQVFSAMRNVINRLESATPVTTADVGAVQTSSETILNMRTSAAAEASGAQAVINNITKRYDRERGEVDKLEKADMATEMVKLTEAQKQDEAILKVIAQHLNKRRLFDYI